jgi:hypothetical protein
MILKLSLQILSETKKTRKPKLATQRTEQAEHGNCNTVGTQCTEQADHGRKILLDLF